MKRVRQTFEEISNSLTNLEVDWMEDPHAGAVIKAFETLPTGRKITRGDVTKLLKSDFRVGCTVLRLFLDLSKDEFTRITAELFKDAGGAGVTNFRSDPNAFVAKLEETQILERMSAEVNRPPEWSDRLVGLFQGGWGSAVKGQLRGRMLEDFTEGILIKVFPPEQIIPRCQFLGANGLSSEKADFAIPSAKDALILIEVKAFNATGSKQTDVLGDIFRIVEQKRDDTAFILVTDGISWKARSSDLRKIIQLQNVGKIRKIYTMAMAKEFESDLRSLKKSF
jgi:DpnII restriction endonuclease